MAFFTFRSIVFVVDETVLKMSRTSTDLLLLTPPILFMEQNDSNKIHSLLTSYTLINIFKIIIFALQASINFTVKALAFIVKHSFLASKTFLFFLFFAVFNRDVVTDLINIC